MRFVGVDPATKTGFVALDIDGNVLVELELKGKGKAEKGGITDEQIANLGHLLYNVLQPGDELVMENAAPGTQRGITTGQIHGMLRYMIYRRKLALNLLMPTSVKKYVAVTGWTGKVGSKRLLKGPEKKKAMAEAVLEHFGYTHKSDNVVDAYIIARISLNLYRMREYMPLLDTHTYQIEVINDILNKA